MLQGPILRRSMLTSRPLSVLLLLGSLLLPPAAAVIAAPDAAMHDPVRESHSRQAESELQVRHRGLRGDTGATPSRGTSPDRTPDTPEESADLFRGLVRLPHHLIAPQTSCRLFACNGRQLYLTTARLRL
jgi:hypothetical protein